MEVMARLQLEARFGACSTIRYPALLMYYASPRPGKGHGAGPYDGGKGGRMLMSGFWFGPCSCVSQSVQGAPNIDMNAIWAALYAQAHVGGLAMALCHV